MAKMTVETARLLAEQYHEGLIPFSDFVATFAQEESQREIKRAEMELRRLTPSQRREALAGF